MLIDLTVFILTGRRLDCLLFKFLYDSL